MKNKKCWVLTDTRAGNTNQSLALANLLNINYEIKKLEYNALGKLPNWFGLNVLKNKKTLTESPLPDLIISSGRRCGGIASALKHKKPNLKIIQIMNSGSNLDSFDAVILPKHDKKPAKKYLNKTVFIHGALSYYPPDKQQKDKQYWEEKFAHLPNPKIGVLIGGVSKGCSFKLSHARDLLDKITRVAKDKKGSLLVVTSRRTPCFANKVIKQTLQTSGIPYTFYDMSSEHEAPNRGVLTLSDILIVTGDSVSMCSEAAELGKPLYIFIGENQLSAKHLRFVELLFADELAKPLDRKLEPFKETKRLSSDIIIDKISKLVF